MIHYVPYLIAFHIITNDILVAMAYTPQPCFQRGVNGELFSTSLFVLCTLRSIYYFEMLTISLVENNILLFECVTNAKTKIPSLKARGR